MLENSIGNVELRTAKSGKVATSRRKGNRLSPECCNDPGLSSANLSFCMVTPKHINLSSTWRRSRNQKCFAGLKRYVPQGAQPLHELHMCTLPNSKSTCCRIIGNWCMEIGLPTAMNKTDWMWVKSLQHWLKTKNALKPRHDQIQVANLPEYDKLQHCPCMQNPALTGLQLLWISGNQLQTSLNQSGKYPAQQIQTEFISFCLDSTTYAHRITRSQTVSTNHLLWCQYYVHSCLLEKNCPSFQILKMTMDQEIGQPMIPFLILQQDRLWGHKVFLRNKMCCLLSLSEQWRASIILTEPSAYVPLFISSQSKPELLPVQQAAWRPLQTLPQANCQVHPATTSQITCTLNNVAIDSSNCILSFMIYYHKKKSNFLP